MGIVVVVVVVVIRRGRHGPRGRQHPARWEGSFHCRSGCRRNRRPTTTAWLALEEPRRGAIVVLVLRDMNAGQVGLQDGLLARLP